ncbi:rhamnulokinase family protein [Nocardioides zeae]|uniref:Rhamnulokinase family protein n=1 Tax=Nocardioides imazamoxiresistens TaxID=3231893 RepID=A0ABU3PW62_9ACTN|nr:rhamnulokinase family protein [Nocardioides zeae]MDT9593414.1 rhamnulokinase family protein [Nocardioides zeae]
MNRDLPTPRPGDLRVAAVDLGATSGRVMVAVVGPGRLELAEVHRFPNGGVPVGDALYWDVLGIHREVLAALRTIAATGPLDAVGIDSWAVDYGLLGRDGLLLGNPRSHRDRRTDGVPEQVWGTVGADELFARTGLQHLPFNTVFQLAAERGTPALAAARTLLLLPDLLGYWLTGEIGAERTNASTTGLYDATTRTWARDLAERLDLPAEVLPPLRDAGSLVGPLLPAVAEAIGRTPTDPPVPVVAVGSHDTASAVVGVPAQGQGSGSRFAYISSGTWSLVGLELDAPVLSEEARAANFTNEAGVDSTVRYLKNVMGLWVLSESVRTWQAQGLEIDLPVLLAAAAEAEPLRTVVDIDDASLLPPGDMPARIAALAEAAGEPVPDSPVATARCIVDSLAVAYRRHLRAAARTAGEEFDVVHVVGGGTHNTLLCQLSADALGVPVLAGPGEAAALGNVLVQARALGADLPDLAAMRALVRDTHELRRYEPRSLLDWDAAERRLVTGRPTTVG